MQHSLLGEALMGTANFLYFKFRQRGTNGLKIKHHCAMPKSDSRDFPGIRKCSKRSHRKSGFLGSLVNIGKFLHWWRGICAQ